MRYSIVSEDIFLGKLYYVSLPSSNRGTFSPDPFRLKTFSSKKSALVIISCL